jgi:hypothetical protein
MADPSGDFSLWNLLRVSHLEWAGGAGVFISLSLTLTFPCGINAFVPGLGSDLFWSVGPFFPFLFPFSYVYYQQLIFIFIYSATYLWDFPRVNRYKLGTRNTEDIKQVKREVCHVAAPEWARSASHCHVSQPYWSMSVWISDRWTPHMPRSTHSLVHINSHLTQPTATWQHHTQPHQTDSAMWHCLIGPCQQVGPTTAETAIKWVPPECHVAVCYLATSSPHATWHHHINTHQCVIPRIIATC